MKDTDKTSEQMTKELVKVRQQIAEMEASETEHKRIEDALRFSTWRLQALLDTAPVVICQSDLTGKITYVNKKFEEVTGYKREEVLFKPWVTTGMLSRKSARLIRNRMVEKLKGRPPTPMDVQVKRKDGQLIWVTGIGEIIWDRRKPVGFHVVAQEITDYKLAQQKIQHAAEEWRTTFDTIPDLVSIHDKDFKIVRLNKAFARTCKMKPQAVVGSTCYELIHGTKEPWADCPLRQALTTRKPSCCEFFNPHLGIYTEVTCSPILNGNGDATTSVHIVRDVTERRQMLETLQESEERYRLVADNAADAIWTVDLNMRPTYVSPSVTRLLGYSVEEAMAKPMEEVFTPASQKLAMGVLAEELAIEELEKKDLFRSRMLEMHMVRKDSSTVPVEIKYTFLRDADTKPVGILAIARDITERKQAEEALRESEERYRALVELGVKVGEAIIMRQDTEQGEGIMTFVSDEWANITGYSKKELLGAPFHELVSPKYQPASLERYRRRMRGESVSGLFELSITRKDGTEVPIELTSAYTIYKGKRANVAFIRNITERKRMEVALKESESKYRAIFETTGTAMIIIEEDSTISLANTEFEKLSGYSKKQIEGKKSWPEFIAESDVERLKEYHHQRRINPDAVPKQYEARFVDRKGNIKDVYATVDIIPGTKQSLASILNISQRKQMEVALQESESKYRTIFETTGVAMVIIEEDTTISLANTEFEKLSGYSKKEIEGKKSWAEFVLKGDLERMKAYHRWRRIDPATAPKQYEFQLVDRNGNVKDIFLAVDLIPGTKKSVASLLDITERKQMQEQLIVADRLATLGELVSGIAHELNNPLTSIIGFAQLLLAKDIPGDIKEDLNVIYEEAERTSKVVRNLLTFARKHEPEKKPVNLNGAIEIVLALRAYEQKVHNIQASTQFTPGLPEIMADGFQLQQVFLNIIINAEYFMTLAHGGGNLNVTTERVGDKIRASFTDDGAGISQENLSHLFDPFFTTKDVGKGTGLGLSICHGIVIEHGGSIYAQSEPGKGTTFVVELPIS